MAKILTNGQNILGKIIKNTVVKIINNWQIISGKCNADFSDCDCSDDKVTLKQVEVPLNLLSSSSLSK